MKKVDILYLKTRGIVRGITKHPREVRNGTPLKNLNTLARASFITVFMYIAHPQRSYFKLHNFNSEEKPYRNDFIVIMHYCNNLSERYTNIPVITMDAYIRLLYV